LIKKFNRERSRKHFLLNYQINASELRLIDDSGKFIGVMNKEQALNLARGEEKDLVLVSPLSQPPVAKVIDFKKFLYQENKKNKDAKKGAKKGSVKDVKLSLFIGPMDRQRMMDKTRDFLSAGHQVRVSLPLRGRELGKKPMAQEAINKFINELSDVASSTEIKMQGKIMMTVLNRKK